MKTIKAVLKWILTCLVFFLSGLLLVASMVFAEHPEDEFGKEENATKVMQTKNKCNSDLNMWQCFKLNGYI